MTTSPLRVLHVAEAFGGGLLEMIRLIAERMAAAGHPSAIAYGRRPETPDDVRAAIAADVTLFELDWRRRAPATQMAAGRRLRELVDQWRPDVVHLHSSFAGFVGAIALRGRVPIVFTPNAFASALAVHGRAQRMLARRLERMIVSRCDVVGAVSDSEAELARALGARRVVVIFNGIVELDEPVLPTPRAPAARPRVIACGRIIAQRQPEACGRILAGVADLADVEWIGGGGDMGAAGRAARAALESAGVRVTGWVPREHVLGEMAASDAYLHYTAWDGLPFSVLEAMSVGTVVVGSDIGPNRQLLDPRQLCRSEEQAIALLRRLLTDEPFRAELAAAQGERAPLFSARRMVDGWMELYAELSGS